MTVSVRGARIELGAREVLHGVDLEVAVGEFVGIVGPNGSGKTTLLRTLYRALRPMSGACLIGGDDVAAIRPRLLARRVAVVAQDPPNDFAPTVREAVMMGRTPHQGLLERDTGEDRRLVADALAAVAASDLADRNLRQLSGGERQRVLIARALAQGAGILLLDEPTNHLDVHHQLDLLHLIRQLGLTILCTLHDLNLAAATCDRVVVLADGLVVADGPPAEALSVAVVERVYGVRAQAYRHPITGAHQLALTRV